MSRVAASGWRRSAASQGPGAPGETLIEIA